jgi:hypothetical protein
MENNIIHKQSDIFILNPQLELKQEIINCKSSTKDYENMSKEEAKRIGDIIMKNASYKIFLNISE